MGKTDRNIERDSNRLRYREIGREEGQEVEREGGRGEEGREERREWGSIWRLGI